LCKRLERLSVGASAGGSSQLGGSAHVSCAPLSVVAMNSAVDIEQASETIHAALSAYKDTCKRFQSNGDALATLQSFHAPLDRLQDRLELILDNDGVRGRLDKIVIGDQAHGRKLLAALESDVQLVSTYLKNLGRPGQGHLKEHDVNVYTNALFRYSEVLKLVLKKDTQYVLFILCVGYDRLLIVYVVILCSAPRMKYCY
jgi:hypothetical protein